MDTSDAAVAETEGDETASSPRRTTDWIRGLLLAGLGPVVGLVQVLQIHRREIGEPLTVLVVAFVAATVLILTTALVCRFWSWSPLSVGGGLGALGYLCLAADLFGPNPVLRLVLSVAVISFGAAAASAVLSGPRRALTAIVVFSLFLSLLGAGYARWRLGHRLAPAGAAAEPTMPNVYYFGLGAFARGDVARHLDPADDPSAFEDAMTSAGFTIDRIATGSYQQHGQSVASTLEQRPLIDDFTPPKRVRADLTPTLQGANVTVEWFRSQGYRYVQTHQPRVEGGGCDLQRVDVCLRDRRDDRVRLPDTLRVVADRTPLGPFLSAQGDVPSTPLLATDVVAAIEDRRLIGRKRPSFVMAQIIPPHPPYTLASTCEKTDAVGTLADGWADRYAGVYMHQLACVRADLARAVTRLVSIDPGALIVVQSDTGPAFELKFGAPVAELNAQMARNRFGAFRAWRLPEWCRTSDERASSLVNTFAVIQACLRGEPPKLLEARAYLVWFDATKVEALPSGILYPGS